MMKKFFTFCIALLLLLSAEISVLALDISPAINVLRENTTFTKCALKGTDASFTKEDFINVVGREFDYITITKTPEKECGKLKISGVEVIEGQCIITESLNLLKFCPSSKDSCASFSFTVSDKNWNGTDITCNINYLSSVNYAPIANNFSMKTIKNIAVYSDIEVYDPEDDSLSYKVGAYPSFGSLSINEELGRVTYTPEKDFTGSDVFTVFAEDKYGNRSNEATVYVSVDSTAGNMTFGDMSKSELHYAAIALSKNNIMTYSKRDGEYYFSPDEKVNKIDFTVMLLCAAQLNDGITQVNDTEFIDDNALSSGRKSYLKRALDVEIVNIGNREFNPFETIKTSDAQGMVARSLGLDIDSEELKNIMGTALYTETLTKESVAEILYNVCLYLN